MGSRFYGRVKLPQEKVYLTEEPLVQESNSAAGETAVEWREAAAWTLALVLFFLSTYIAAGWVTTQRATVPSVVFSWERYIPFLPWTIVPYWSTDVFFLCAPFLFRTRSGLRTYAARIITVQMISIAVFLLFPLKFSLGRPHIDGLLGIMFAIRTGIDTQYNEAPSLHIGFAVVIWLACRDHLHGWRWRAAQACLILMSLATLTTYRHHFIDLPTGVWTGVFSAALNSEDRWTQRRRFQLSLLYVVGATLFFCAAYRAGTMGWLVVWLAGPTALIGYNRRHPKRP